MLYILLGIVAIVACVVVIGIVDFKTHKVRNGARRLGGGIKRKIRRSPGDATPAKEKKSTKSPKSTKEKKTDKDGPSEGKKGGA